MDDLMSKFSEVILQTFAAEARLEEEFKKCTLKLDEHITQSITNGTPVQNKKRPKRLDSLDDAADPEPEPEDPKSASTLTATTSSSSSSSSRTSSRKNSVRQKSLETAPAAVAAASVTIPELEETTSGRPARSARVKAIKNLKEPGLSHKLRQPSLVTIKQERISVEVRKDKNDGAEPMELDGENDANLINGVAPIEQKKSSDEGFGSTNEKEDGNAGAEPSREMSIMVVPQPFPKVEVLSDDEAAEKMPPPAMPPPSKPAAKSKAKSKKVKNSDVFPVPIKKEKDADDSAVSSAESTLSNASSVRSSSTRAASKKKKESSVQAPIVHIKKEKISTGKTKEKGSTHAASPSASEKSVYEDALEGGDAVMKPLVVSIGKMPLVDAEKNRTFAMDKNGTFTAANGTFVVPSPTTAANGTFNVKSPENVGNATFDVRPPAANSTFVMDNKKSTPEVNASIMTEDNSLVENSPEKPPAVVPAAKKPVVAKKPQTTQSKTTKKNNELFSLQSPIKSRIEAFEKAAVASPMHTRTGTTSSKHTTPSQPSRLPSKTSTTPLASQRFPSSAKASQHHTPTAQNNLPTSKGISASASKLAHLQKKPQITSSSKSQSLSREPSMERQPGTLSAASSSSSLAVLDEKKKKREEKQRLAAQQREQMEKDKREHAERLMREKEEKHRKLVQEKEEKLRAEAVKKARKMEEFEKRRHLEELNQRMLAEQKREELAKLEQQQRAEQADLFKMNQAKENYEIKLHKQMYQQKMQQQQKLAHAQQQQLQLQQQQQQLQLKKKHGAASDKETFTFDMIETDDSTDDESTNTAPNKKTKRPPLPSWCSKEERRQPMRIQAEIKLKVIDQFFSVAPMTPDLREIFPAIDARKLKRNSSAVWRTPPRYSQMPKY